MSETAELDRAVAESGAIFRSLIIAEAIQAGLSKRGDPTLSVERRCRRVDVWLPRGIGGLVKRAARAHGTTQQKLLRYFLFDYIASGPWKATEAAKGEEVVAS